jgi:hypothetical protein
VPLTSPPRDDQGIVPHDHQEIYADDLVIRRVSEAWTVDDPKAPGGKRLSTMAFEKSSGPNGGMSVDLKRQIEEAGIDPKQWVTTPRWTGSVILRVGELRAEGFRVGFDPLDDNPYHGEVWGQFSKGRKKKLMSLCSWFVPLDGVALGEQQSNA